MTTTEKTTETGQLGWVISYRVPREVSLPALRDGLRLADLDEKLAPDLSSEHALRRALRDMSEQRVIRKLRRENDRVYFQLTHEDKSENRIEYWREADVWIDTKTGLVSSDHESVADEARKLLNEHLAKRLTSDLTRLLQRIFDRAHGDLVPIREQGGAYFVPERQSELVDKSRALLEAIGGKLRSFAVRLGSAGTEASVADAMSEYLSDLINEFRTSCEGLNADSRSDVITRRSGKIAELRTKLDCYRGILAGYADTIQLEIEAANQALLLALTKSAEAVVESEPAELKVAG